MMHVEHQRQVHRMLEKVLEKDHAKTKISGVSDLGLVEMTRKRTRESLGQMLTEACACCDGRGTVKTAETICYDIFREILREERAYDVYLDDNNSGYVVGSFSGSMQIDDTLIVIQNNALADLYIAKLNFNNISDVEENTNELLPNYIELSQNYQ